MCACRKRRRRRSPTIFGELEIDARAGIPASTPSSSIVFERTLDVRYLGQGYDVSVPIASTDDLCREAKIRVAFNVVYHRLYGRVFDKLDLEIMSLRVTARRARTPIRRARSRNGNRSCRSGCRRLARRVLSAHGDFCTPLGLSTQGIEEWRRDRRPGDRRGGGIDDDYQQRQHPDGRRIRHDGGLARPPGSCGRDRENT